MAAIPDDYIELRIYEALLMLTSYVFGYLQEPARLSNSFVYRIFVLLLIGISYDIIRYPNFYNMANRREIDIQCLTFFEYHRICNSPLPDDRYITDFDFLGHMDFIKYDNHGKLTIRDKNYYLKRCIINRTQATQVNDHDVTTTIVTYLITVNDQTYEYMKKTTGATKGFISAKRQQNEEITYTYSKELFLNSEHYVDIQDQFTSRFLISINRLSNPNEENDGISPHRIYQSFYRLKMIIFQTILLRKM